MSEEMHWSVVRACAWTSDGLYRIDRPALPGCVEWRARFVSLNTRGIERLGVFESLEEAQKACERHASSVSLDSVPNS